MKASIDKKFSTVQVEYESEKLEAIRFYLRDRNATLERELVDAMDFIFKKNVPVAVREYIEKKNAPLPQPAETEQQSDK